MRRKDAYKEPSNEGIRHYFNKGRWSYSRPQSSCKGSESICESPISFVGYSKSFFAAHRASEPICVENSSPLRDKFQLYGRVKNQPMRLKIKKIQGRLQPKPLQIDFKPKAGLNLVVNGRPLTASSVYKEHKRPKSYCKKRESIFSAFDSEIITPLDPKFYDEEYTNLDEYAQLLLSQPNVAEDIAKPELPITSEVSQKEIPEKNNNISSNPANKERESPVGQRIGLIISTRIAIGNEKSAPVRNKGKLLKGRCNKSWVHGPIRSIHNIQIS